MLLATGCFHWQVVVYAVYKLRHSDVVVMKHPAGTRNEIPYKTYISDFWYSEKWQNGTILQLIFATFV